MKSVKIRFLRTYIVQSVGGPTYPEGSVHLMREESALHFTRRGLAEFCPADTPVSEPPKVEPPKPKAPALEERELTTTIDLISAFNRARQAALEPPKPPAPHPKGPEPEPVVCSFGANPLVSCVMPTWNRREFVKAAIDCWLKQTYENRELIVLDDGDDSVRSLVPRRKGIRYYRRDKREITGTKRNQVNELARGEIICHWDDDDWSAPDRIADQVQRLRETGKPITGYGTLYFWDVTHQEAKRYRAAVASYVCGTTLCYLQSYWKEHPFQPKQEASDNSFVYPALKLIASSHDARHMVARIHACHHTSSKNGISEKVGKEVIPELFWENEKLRIG